MTAYWLLITFSWFGTASLQYINTAGADAESMIDPLDSTVHFPPLPYTNYFNLPTSRNEYETFQNDAPNPEIYGQFYQREDQEQPPDLQRKRRTTLEEKKEEMRDRHWLPNLVDTDKTLYLKNDDQIGSPFVVQYSGVIDENATESNLLEAAEKKSFSPWGGKRDNKASVEHMWTWKRAANIREPSMPKRVRFSPWGGKRSGQMIFKPGSKGSKIIFSTSVPELTRIVSNYSPNGERFNMAGFQFVPSLDKRHPIKILALSSKMNDATIREALPFKKFIESLPRVFKLGHPYTDINLKKDGKRKVKFSAWGGKRSPPIIGPIWTPAPDNLKESTLNAILLIRQNEQDKENQIATAL